MNKTIRDLPRVIFPMTAFQTLRQQVPLRFTPYIPTLFAQFTGKAKFHSVCVVPATAVSTIPQNITSVYCSWIWLNSQNMIGVFAVKQKLAFLINTSREKYSKFRCVHAISSNSLTKVKKKNSRVHCDLQLGLKMVF